MKSGTIKTLELMDALPDRRNWRDEAKCTGDDPARWEVANLNPLNKHREAVELCRGCPVTVDCFLDARNPQSVTPFLGVIEADSELRTFGVVRGGRVFETPDAGEKISAFKAKRMARLQAVEKMVQAGASSKEVSEELGVTKRSVERWRSELVADGRIEVGR